MTDKDRETGHLEAPVSRDEARAAAQASPPEEVGEELGGAPVVEKHSNVDQTVIRVTEDKARLALVGTVSELAKRRGAWAPFGLFAGLMTSLLTADFDDVLGVDAQIVEGIVITVAFLSGVYTVIALARGRSTTELVEDTINKLKGQ